jgi:hypothetical protein
MMRWPVISCEKVDAGKHDVMLACRLRLVEVAKGIRFRTHAVLYMTGQIREQSGDDV